MVIHVWIFWDLMKATGAGLILAPDDNVAVVMATNYFDSAEFNMSTWETAAGVMTLLLNAEK